MENYAPLYATQEKVRRFAIAALIFFTPIF